MDAFLSEVALNKPKTLEELNEALDLWINNYYHKNIHTSLDGLTPEVAFKSDKRALKFVDAAVLTEAFLHTESRQVDKTGCVNFGGKKYDVGVKLIGRKVDLYYDPTWTDEVEVHHKDFETFKAKVMTIAENCGVRTELPEGTRPLEAASSRLLDGLNKANISNRTNKETAISFRNIGGTSNV